MWTCLKEFFMTPIYIWRSLKMKSSRTAQTIKIIAGSLVLVIIVVAILLAMARFA